MTSSLFMMWDHVDVRDDDECWPYTGCVQKGYGKAWAGRQMLAHRIAYIEATGEEPVVIDHECHNRDATCPGGWECRHRRCCNPAHLVASTKGDNLRASPITLATVQSERTHCPAGHEYTEENTYVWRGMRHCRECGRRRSREYQRRKREV